MQLRAEPRLLARYAPLHRQWEIERGEHKVYVGRSAGERETELTLRLDGRLFGN